MPIAVKDYTWEETESNVNIVVPLKGVKSHKVDIFSTEEYLKVSYPPYFFEVLLFAPVEDTKSSAQVGNGAVVFNLTKKEPVLWSQLQSPDFNNKEFMRQKREDVIKKAHERAEQDAKDKADKKREADRFSIKEQMRVDDEERKRIENAKEEERRKATEELEQWKAQQKALAEEEKIRLLEENRLREEEFQRVKSLEDENSKQEQIKKQQKKKEKKKNIFESEAKGSEVRKPGHISVSFTERVFPTAARESQAEQEDEWLRKQAETRRIAEMFDKDLTEEEKNPQWLRDKGSSFFKAGNYHAAINAFSHGIKLDSKMPSLYSNRAACHLKLGNLIKCAEDCTKALELLTPPVPQNANSRCKAHVRRGTAYCHLQLYVEGLMDYEEALKIDPSNEQLKIDAERIRKIIQGTEEV
ncbi:dynein assembly factor 4, axonemal [Lingula anatina]|uniref:Dynein axonemal assembly factor 4 n=1 Tax=Lingula anatina TaxID=7574 RepID=A0A1S3J8Z5_LINAN|nr:dynein assembly factor 4, axonemal [Lingula anatina]|eukprot:XP_013406783.1 dynein assembly factor 4, axonemal [Lingula anatina]